MYIAIFNFGLSEYPKMTKPIYTAVTLVVAEPSVIRLDGDRSSHCQYYQLSA